MNRYFVEFEIKTIPQTLNQAIRSHWSAYSADSKSIGFEIANQVKNRPALPIKKASILITRFSSGKLDRDNKFFTSKHILDNLVHLKILENDTEDHVVELIVNQVKIKRGEQRKIIVKLMEVK